MDEKNDTTMKQQADAITTVSKLMGAAMALPERLAKQLREARAVLETLQEYQHPKLSIDLNYSLKDAMGDSRIPPATLIEREIKRINDILGDRA